KRARRSLSTSPRAKRARRRRTSSPCKSAAARPTPGVATFERPGEELAPPERRFARVGRAHVREVRVVVRDAEHAEPRRAQPREHAFLASSGFTHSGIPGPWAASRAAPAAK